MKSLTSDVSAFLLFCKALPLGDIIQQVDIVAGDIVKKVEEKIDIVGALRQNLLLNCGFINLYTLVGR